MYLTFTNGNTTVILFSQINDNYDLVYKNLLVHTSITNQHIDESVDFCYKTILKWNDEYIK